LFFSNIKPFDVFQRAVIFLNETNRMSQINQINKTGQINQIDQMNRTDASRASAMDHD